MSFLLVPHEVSDTTATVWVAAIDEKLDGRSVELEVSGKNHEDVIDLEMPKWAEWKSYREKDRGSYLPWDHVLASRPRVRSLRYRRVKIQSLKPRTRYSLKMRIGGRTEIVGLERHLREGWVTTLPDKLPKEGEGKKPFTLLLGSCFYGPEDPAGMVGTTYCHLPKRERPDVKILCGDQVYLDNPWRETTFGWYYSFRAPGFFRDMLFRKYEDNWKQVRGEDAGFRRLLRDGANYFCSDDHEFWNNAPNFGGVGLFNTLTGRQRRWWFQEAKNLFRVFQAWSPLMQFKVGRLSFCIVDTRINRDKRGRRFMYESDLAAVRAWIDELEGPGVLIVGQPVLTEKVGVVRALHEKGLKKGSKEVIWRYIDKNLPDYRQYKDLIGHIQASRYSMVVLTGDVHFGRIAHGQLTPGSKNMLVEVIASPMQAVEGDKGEPLFGTYQEASVERFPRFESIRPGDTTRNHFATVQFSSSEDDEVYMEVKYWPILRSGDEIPLEAEILRPGDQAPLDAKRRWRTPLPSEASTPCPAET